MARCLPGARERRALRIPARPRRQDPQPAPERAPERRRARHAGGSQCSSPNPLGLHRRRDRARPTLQVHIAASALKLPEGFVLHSLRHTFLTRLGASGADAFSIKRIAGHSSVTISEKYIHPTPGRLDVYDSVLWTWLLAFPVPPRRFFDGLCQVDGENT